MVVRLLCLLLICWPVSGYARTHSALLSLYVFAQGKPAQRAQVLISSTVKHITEVTPSAALNEDKLLWLAPGKETLLTNTDGVVAGQLPPGDYRFDVKVGRFQHQFALTLHPHESAQLILSFEANQTPELSLESSHIETTLVDSQDVVNKEQDGQIGMASFLILSDENKPIANADIFLSGLSKTLKSDSNGRVTAEIPVGRYAISVIHPSFNTQTLDDIDISVEAKTDIQFSLTPTGLELPEYVVLEPHLAGSLISAIDEQKDAAQVASVLSAEQFSRAGDSDTASALKRVAGLTLIGGKFIFIRGLGERFSSTLINGAAIPSPDPTRRVVPMDLFPTNILDSVLVQKGYSTDRPGEFAGGVVELRTRGIPDEFFFHFSSSTSGNTQSTLQDSLTYKGGDRDFLSFDDGTRALPESIKQASAAGPITVRTRFNPDGLSAEQLEGLSEDLSDVWNIDTRKPGPDANMQTAIGDVFDLGDFRFGYTASGGWNQTFRNQNEINREVAFSGTPGDASGQLRVTQDFDVQRSWREVNLTGYGATELEYQDSQKLFARAIYLRQSRDEARFSEGNIDQEITALQRTKLWYFTNELFMHQLGGEHTLEFANDFKIDWLFTDATARRLEPKTRDFRFDQDTDGTFFFSRRADSNQTSFSELVDKDISWRVDTELPIDWHQNLQSKFIGGMINQRKERNSAIQRFIFSPEGPLGRQQETLAQPTLEDVLTPDNIGADGFLIRDATRATDSYFASQDLLSYYGKLDLNLFERLRITGGVRWENNRQLVRTFQSVANQAQAVETTINKLDKLPSVAATLTLTDNQQIRAGFSKTISRPDFRELSPAPFTDPNTNKETIGNPDLEQTDVTSVDARWEFYPSPDENLSAGFFYKDLKQPIELVNLPGQSLQTFQNNEAATLWGFEFEFLKHLNIIHPWLDKFSLGGNYTWSKSNVTLTEENLQAQTSVSRSLQGHSKHIINANLSYDNTDTGTQATLLYNVASKRIVAVGLLGAPDLFEQPFHQLDFVINQDVNDWLSMKFMTRNLLNSTFKVEQGSFVTRKFQRGRDFTIGFNLKF
ncbi:MAG: TonB-dependent receptor [Methylococcales bacterium]|nr:TonB-dependent receptor [Methylococcales bacterium]